MTPSKGLVRFESATENFAFPDVYDVSCEEVAAKRNAVHIIDVRTGEEFNGELGHIPGARLVTLPILQFEIDNLPKDETIVFVCRSGCRSAHAVSMAIEFGFEHVFNMGGGMLRWNSVGLETEKTLNASETVY